MRRKRNILWIVLICVALLAAAAVTTVLLPRDNGAGDGEATFIRTAGEAGVTVEAGLSPDSFRDDPAVTAWLEKCDRPDRDDQEAYALRYTDTAPDGTVTCSWLILRRETANSVGQPTVTVSETRDGQLTLTVTYTGDGAVTPGSLCRISGSFDSIPDMEIDGTLGLIVSVTNKPF